MVKFGKIIIGLVFVFCYSQFALGAVFTVTKTADTNDGTCDSDCSLREAVVAANGVASNDSIVFSMLFDVPQTITLSGTDIIITNNGTLQINGPGADKLTVSGNNVSRVFTNNTGSVATISNLRVTGGTGVSTVTTGRGGGVYNNGGTLTLDGLVISGNTAANGGAANNAGTATLNIFRCAIFNNSVTGSGGAMQNFAGNTTNIRDSSIYNNTSNSTTGGGAIQANGTVNITNTTFSGNNANTGSGGAIVYNGTALSITNSTIANNTATNNGGGIHKSTANIGVIRNTIIANNIGTAASPDATGTFNSEGNNIIGNIGTSTGWIASDLQNTNPALAAFGFYGGNGLSYALVSGSPAINAAQNCVTDLTCATNNPPVALTADQRGAARIGNVDIGAFEVNNSGNGGTFVAELPKGQTNSPYNFTLIPNNGTLNYSLTAGAFPSGVNLTTMLSPNAVVSVNGTTTQSGIFNFTVTGTDGAASIVTNYRVQFIAPVAANVFIAGRVMTTDGRGIRNAVVTLTDNNSNTRSVRTSTFGYYRFEALQAGETYLVQVNAKRYTFMPRTITVFEDLTGVDFTADF